ncbi:3066_t:CDS:2, partial [Gigaspora margarita]
LGLNTPEIVATIRNALKILVFFNYKKAIIEKQQVLVQHISKEEKTRQELIDKKENLLASKYGTIDYKVEEVLKQAKHFKKNLKELLKLLVHSKALAMAINNGTCSSINEQQKKAKNCDDQETEAQTEETTFKKK